MTGMRKSSQDMRQHIIDVARSLMTHRGYTAVGLNEVLTTAGVPKGSFYHYFKSKEEFGEAMLECYFDDYLSRIAGILAGEASGAQCLENYFLHWADTQNDDIDEHKCLVVKLGAEVCDLSEGMRAVMARGTSKIVERIASCIERGMEDGSIPDGKQASLLAESLYQLWLGASLRAKLTHSEKPFDLALNLARQLMT